MSRKLKIPFFIVLYVLIVLFANNFVMFFEISTYEVSKPIGYESIFFYLAMAFYIAFYFLVLKVSPFKKLTTWLFLAIPINAIIHSILRDYFLYLSTDNIGVVSGGYDSVLIFMSYVFGIVGLMLMIVLLFIFLRFCVIKIKSKRVEAASSI